MKPYSGALFVLKLFLSLVSYHCLLVINFISHPLFGIICCCSFIRLLLIFGVPERDSHFNFISVGCMHMHYAISCIHYSASCTHYSNICSGALAREARLRSTMGK